MKRIKTEKRFWNSKDMVGYFKDKPADPRVINRLNLLQDRSSLKALDLGCGGGRHSEMLISMGFQTYGCDINEMMIDATKERISPLVDKSYVQNHFLSGSIVNIPFKDNFFDVVVTTGVLHQAQSLEDYRDAIVELSRVCKTGAVICLNIFTNKTWDETYKRVKDEEYSVITKEGVYMTLLPKEIFYQLMKTNRFILESELGEDTKEENTGMRSVLRANFIKS